MSVFDFILFHTSFCVNLNGRQYSLGKIQVDESTVVADSFSMDRGG